MKEMGLRSVLIKWFASYLNERSHFTQFGKEASHMVKIDFQKDRTVTPAIRINDCVLERVSSYKLCTRIMDR